MILSVINTILLFVSYYKYKRYRKDNFMINYMWYWFVLVFHIILLYIYISFDFVSNREEIEHPIFFEIMFTYCMLLSTTILYPSGVWRFTFTEEELIFVKLNGKKVVRKIDDLDCARTYEVYGENFLSSKNFIIFVFIDGNKVKVLDDGFFIGYDFSLWQKLHEILKKKKIKRISSKEYKLIKK
jgi:hypothetical protein